jgi:NAD(P)-dependent dehydrogenase (short-subunit alcohol dehydrogenase family)
MAINVTGPMYLIRRCLGELLKAEPKGAIVNICSVAAVRGSVAGVAYTASKHALLGVSRTTAWAYAKTGLRCNAVLPGGVGGTDVLKGSDPGMFQSEGGMVTAPYQACMPQICKPADIANAVLFLVTAPAVNGAELAVDQGWTVA